MTGKRISMSEYFMGMAMHARKRADCVGNRVGAVLALLLTGICKRATLPVILGACGCVSNSTGARRAEQVIGTLREAALCSPTGKMGKKS
jgi:hypothetical protein